MIARPGPFVMAELKNEGVPYRIYREHPAAVPIGWDGEPAPSATLDYLEPGYLGAAERWYAAIMPVLAERLVTRGGPVAAVQLDNEIGMLSWVTNTPELTDSFLTGLAADLDDAAGGARRSSTGTAPTRRTPTPGPRGGAPAAPPAARPSSSRCTTS